MATISRTFYDATVATDGTGDYATIAAAITDNKRTIYVRQGSYAGFTQDQSQSKIFVEPGSTITSDCNFTGTNCSFVVGAGTDIQGEVDVTTGTGAYIRFENGCSIDQIDINTARCYVNGGGWGTSVDATGTAGAALDSNGDDVIMENIATNTDTGGSDFYALLVSGDRNIVRLVKIVDSDVQGALFNGSADLLMIGCANLNSDNDNLNVRGARNRIIGNYLVNGLRGIDLDASGDDSVMVGNTISTASSQSIFTASGNANCCIVGNRLDGTPTDTDGSATVSNNDETAF